MVLYLVKTHITFYHPNNQLITWFLGTGGTYGAAAGDISPDISGGLCDAPTDYDMSKCSNDQAESGYEGPACPKNNCGTCYTVTNLGGYGGDSVGGVGNSITVQIIDSCPSGSADNYCKTDVPADERCGSSSTNALDIDQSAYQALTGTPFGSGPNLMISIAPSDCSGGDTSVSGSPDAATVTTPAASATSSPASNDNNNNNNPAPSSTPAPSGGGGTAQLYEQCGGIDNSNNGPWSGPTTCASGSTCQEQNQYYSQCVPSSKKRDVSPITHPLLSRREAVVIKDTKPFFLSGES